MQMPHPVRLATRWFALALVLALAAVPCAGQSDLEPGFEGLAAVEPAFSSDRAVRASDSGQGDLREPLRLLSAAISRARAVLWEASRDSKDRHLLDPSYTSFESLMDRKNHLLAGGSIFASPSEGRRPYREGVYEFYFDPALADRLEEPLIYLKASGDRAPAAYRSLLNAYEKELKRMRSLVLSVPESKWRLLPTVALKALLTIEAQTRVLNRVVDAARDLNAPVVFTQRFRTELQQVQSFLHTGLGVSEDGQQIDLDRAFSAFTLSTPGSVLRGRPNAYRLSSELSGALWKAAGLEGVTIGGSSNKLAPLDHLKWIALDDLFETVVVPAGLPLLDQREAEARRIIGRRVFLVHATVEALQALAGGADAAAVD
jgi:hypothetical protein